jgi:hypothetical protein
MKYRDKKLPFSKILKIFRQSWPPSCCAYPPTKGFSEYYIIIRGDKSKNRECKGRRRHPTYYNWRLYTHKCPHYFLRLLVIPHVMGRTSPLSCWVLCLWWCCWPCQDFQLLHNFREWRSLSWVPAISIPPTNTIFMSQYCCRTTYGTTTAVYGHNRFAIPGWLGAESFLSVTRYYYFMQRQKEAWALQTQKKNSWKHTCANMLE